MQKFVVLSEEDNVATCLAEIEAGYRVELEIAGKTTVIDIRDAIPFGHKIAILSIAAGEEVRKYGAVIGQASQAIEPGQWVHVHNVESVRARGDIR